MDLDSLSDDLKQLVVDELDSDEKPVWVARPDPARFARTGWPVTLFAIPWTAFAVFWTGAAFWGTRQAGGPGPPCFDLCFPLFGVPFILIGLGMFTAPFWLRRAARQTVYVITDRRAILFEGSYGLLNQRKVQSFPPAELNGISRTQNADGSGNVILHESSYRDTDGDRRTRQVGFFAIEDVKRVEGLLRELAGRAQG
jgi:hypothetical protein